ncbi:MAG: BatD family protein, partial [Oleibacter sp.]|nr:BatD family protein [Thalassolituus sp.]
ASVDRKEISQYDSLVLKVTYQDVALLSEPDFSPLEADWDITSNSRSTQIQFSNGKNNSISEWTLVLFPKRTGTLTIPPLPFGNVSSNEITIEVTESSNSQPVKNDNFYFEVEVSSGEHYVQEEILYIERIYFKVQHESPNLSPFTVANARLELLQEPQRQVIVKDGQRIGLYERRYAIFPEKSGTLAIPSQRFSATVNNNYRTRGQTETIVSSPIELEVKAIPDNYPQATWLPARKLSLTEKFSDASDQWQAGEPVTRTFTLVAEGLSSGQIPPIPLPELDNVRYYPDQTQDNTDVTPKGLITQVTQSVAMVPTREGQLLLPELQVPWWNTLTNTLEFATLPARTIDVGAGIMPAAPITQAMTTPVSPSDLGGGNAVAPMTAPTNPLWLWVSIGLGATNLVTLIALGWLISRRKQFANSGAFNVENVGGYSGMSAGANLGNGLGSQGVFGAETSNQTQPDSVSWQDVKKACQSNQPLAIREAILAWFNDSRNEMTSGSGAAHTLNQIANYFNDAQLNNALAELDAVLFSGQSNSAFNGSNVLNLLENAKKTARSSTPSELPGLYPDK